MRSGPITPRAATADRGGVWLARLASIRATAWLLVAALIASAYTLTYTAGGTSSGLPHLFYLPIFLGAFTYGPVGGTASGLAAGAVAARLPVHIQMNMIEQETRAWVLRLIAFALAGLIVGSVAASMRKRIHRLRRLSEQVVLAFVHAVDAKHPYTAEHSTSVAAHAVRIARELGLRPSEIERVRLAALLHDVGKISVPVSLLETTGPLSDADWAVMRRHPEASARIVEGVDEFRPSLAGIRHHHERLDGTGYPAGLCGDEIPLDARIIAVADTYDAMTSDRPYQDARTPHDALAELRAGAGTQLDAEIVEAFARTLEHSRHAPHPVAATATLAKRGIAA